MSANRVLFDEPGPKGRRRIRIATIASLVVLALIVFVAIQRFGDNGQLAGSKWSPFLKPGIPRLIWRGLENTLKVAGVGALFAFPFGALLGLFRLSASRILRF